MSLMNSKMFARPWKYGLSAVSADHLPGIQGVEVAFVGRSNVGKSSLINAILNQSGLARVSNVPGRTQALNFYYPIYKIYEVDTADVADVAGNAVQQNVAIVDMPGYGYARAPNKTVANWTDLIFAYLKGRPNLRRVYLLVDSRHGIKASDFEVMDVLDYSAVSYQVILTKVDKIASDADSPQAIAVMQSTVKLISKRPAAHPEVIITSTYKRWGLDEIRKEIAAIYEAK